MYKPSKFSFPPHLKYNFLIVSKTSFFNVHGLGWFVFKGVSWLSLVCLAGNVDDLEDDVAGSDDVSLHSESELSSYEIIISSSAARTRSSYVLA